MKTRFTTLDIGFELGELQRRLIGMRVNRVYDVDHKTYLIKLQRPQEKTMLLMESGIRIHTTRFEWPKNEPPSGFTMKLRKHLTNKRLESIKQLGLDRVIDMQFGTDAAAHHLIIELYDKGNMVLTDHEYTILNILRPRVKGEEKFLARQTYPVESAKQPCKDEFTSVEARNLFNGLKQGGAGTQLRKIFLPHFDYGPAFLDHLLTIYGLDGTLKVKVWEELGEENMNKVVQVFNESRRFSFQREKAEGYIRQSKQPRPSLNANEEAPDDFYRYQEFHPMAFAQFKDDAPDCVKAFDDFDTAVDDFFSNLESQKIDAKALQQEQQSLKKLENVKKDHAQRIGQLEKDQTEDKLKGQYIEMNMELVDKALNVIRTALANQIDWKEIRELVEEASESGDPVVSRIKKLKLEVNQISMLLSNPFEYLDSGSGSESEGEKMTLVDLDIDLSAQANARKYYIKKKSAANKVVKTVQSQSLAIKSAEKRAKQAMRDVNSIARIVKQRKVFWFEKFLWFISSENYLVIAGRDQQQNELVVKKYLGPNDIYVHAEVQGASSVIIKNPGGGEVPPKTLHEAGQMALCYSVAWDSKVVISAYWVYSHQVSKSAPTGEYLSVGSFMIRGKKNFLPPSQLALGYGFMFKLDEDSIERHANERKVKTVTETSEDKVEEVEAQLEELSIEEEDEDNEEKDDPAPVIEEEHEEKGREDAEPDKEHKGGEASESDQEKPEIEFPDTELKMNFSVSKGVEFVSAAKDVGKLEPAVFVEIQSTKKPGINVGRPMAKNETRQVNIAQKRGKKGKNKKREKYKDQDEEDKELAMQLLQKSSKEDSKKNRKKQAQQAAEERKKRNAELVKERQIRNQQRQQNKMNNLNDEDDLSGDESGVKVNNDVGMLNSLTGCPVAEDSLLFAVPVTAPYSTMTNYKYKVKVTPGSSKRGKAAKTALNVFINDKTGSQRDKDMLKSVKEQDFARNLPGKVKVSTLVKK